MDNQDNANCPTNQFQNPNFYSPFKESSYKISQQGNDYKYINNYSPFKSNISLNFTPSKKIDLNNGYCQSLGETPLPSNMNFPFSPLTNHNRADISCQRSQFQQRGQFFNEYSPFQPMNSSPNNNQRISDKK